MQSPPTQDNESLGGGKAQCCEKVKVTRKTATAVVREFARGISQGTATGVASAISSLFAPECSVFCNPARCVTGRAAVYKVFFDYMESGIETNQHVEIRQIIWDQRRLSGSVEWTWHATVTKDGIIPGVPAGGSYAQDDAHVFKLNDCGEIIYWREYFDPAQSQSFYRPPPKCCSSGSPAAATAVSKPTWCQTLLAATLHQVC